MLAAKIPNNESGRLQKLISYQVLDTNAEKEYDDIAKLASFICGTPIALISLVDEDRQWFKSRIGLEPPELPRNIAFCAHTILSEDILIVSDSSKDERFHDNPLTTDSPHIQFYAGAPLITPDGWKIGTLCVIDQKPRELSKEQLAALKTLSQNVIALLELRLNMQKVKDLERAINEHSIVSVTNDTGHINFVNDKFCKISKYSQEELIGNSHKLINSGFHPDNFFQNLWQNISSGNAWRGDIKNKAKDGSIFWVDMTILPLLNEKGKPYQYIALHQDITTRKQLEQSLIERNAFIQKITDSVPSLIGYWTSDLRCAFANSAYLEWFGKEPEEMIGMQMIDLLGEELYRKNEPYILNAIKGEVQRFERIIKKPNGTIGYTWAQYIPDIVDGKVKGFFALVIDVTEVKEAENKLKAVLESIPEGLIEINLQGEVIYANNASTKILNISKQEVKGLDYRSPYFKHFTLDNKPYPLEEMPFAVAMREKRLVGPFEYSIVGNDEIKKYLSVYAVPLFNKDNLLYGVIASFRDVTERIEFQNKIIKAKEEANRANNAKSEFLSNMSHEIRTPMNSILGFSELLEKKLPDGILRQYAKSITISGQILLKLINDILDLSKIESGIMQLNYTIANPKNIFLEMQTIFSQKIKEKNIQLLLEINSDLPQSILLDETKLRQILLNLIGNALKFTEDGHIKIYVHSNFSNPDKNSVDMTIQVEDTGIGISQEEQDIIFNAFTQAKNLDTNKYGGTGLGLAIVKKLTDLLGGEIHVVSKLGAGTVFSIILKELKIATGQELDSESETFDLDNIEFEPATILVVDDILSNRQVILNFLEPFPTLKCIEAENGKIAIEKTIQFMPDLILMDMKMPVKNGFEAIREMKENKNTSHIPILAVTASAFEKSKLEISKICEGYMHKPVSQAQLVQKVAAFLKVKVKEQEKPTAKFNKTDISEEKRDRYKELYQILIKDKLQKSKELLEVIAIFEIKKFVEQMKMLGIKYGYFPLTNWAENMEKVVSLFDSTKIKYEIEQFSIIVDDLKKNIYE